MSSQFDEHGTAMQQLTTVKHALTQKAQELNEAKQLINRSSIYDKEQTNQLKIAIEGLLIDIHEELFAISEQLASAFSSNHPRQIEMENNARMYEHRMHLIMGEINSKITDNAIIKSIKNLGPDTVNRLERKRQSLGSNSASLRQPSNHSRGDSIAQISPAATHANYSIRDSKPMDSRVMSSGALQSTMKRQIKTLEQNPRIKQKKSSVQTFGMRNDQNVSMSFSHKTQSKQWQGGSRGDIIFNIEPPPQARQIERLREFSDKSSSCQRRKSPFKVRSGSKNSRNSRRSEKKSSYVRVYSSNDHRNMIKNPMSTKKIIKISTLNNSKKNSKRTSKNSKRKDASPVSLSGFGPAKFTGVNPSSMNRSLNQTTSGMRFNNTQGRMHSARADLIKGEKTITSTIESLEDMKSQVLGNGGRSGKKRVGRETPDIRKQVAQRKLFREDDTNLVKQNRSMQQFYQKGTGKEYRTPMDQMTGPLNNFDRQSLTAGSLYKQGSTNTQPSEMVRQFTKDFEAMRLKFVEMQNELASYQENILNLNQNVEELQNENIAIDSDMRVIRNEHQELANSIFNLERKNNELMKENQNLKTMIYAKDGSNSQPGYQNRALPMKAGNENKDRMKHILQSSPMTHAKSHREADMGEHSTYDLLKQRYFGQPQTYDQRGLQRNQSSKIFDVANEVGQSKGSPHRASYIITERQSDQYFQYGRDTMLNSDLGQPDLGSDSRSILKYGGVPRPQPSAYNRGMTQESKNWPLGRLKKHNY